MSREIDIRNECGCGEITSIRYSDRCITGHIIEKGCFVTDYNTSIKFKADEVLMEDLDDFIKALQKAKEIW